MIYCILIGVLVDEGQCCFGCLMGFVVYCVVGLFWMLIDLGYMVEDCGDVVFVFGCGQICVNVVVYYLFEIIVWIEVLVVVVSIVMFDGLLIFMGGDYLLFLGMVVGVVSYVDVVGCLFFVIWLDVYSDFYMVEMMILGNLYGMFMVYVVGCVGFDFFLFFFVLVLGENICMFGICLVDLVEYVVFVEIEIIVNDMCVLDEQGIVVLLCVFFDRVCVVNGMLYVSFDVDFFDLFFVFVVGIIVFGGIIFCEVYLVCEFLYEFGLMILLDLVELNLFLDECGKIVWVMVDLVGLLMGCKVFDCLICVF